MRWNSSPTNGRATIDEDDDDFWFGYEQEYFLWDPETDLPWVSPGTQPLRDSSTVPSGPRTPTAGKSSRLTWTCA